MITIRKTKVPAVRRILLNREIIGRIRRIESTDDYDAHWQGSVEVNDNTWRISEENLDDVKKRVQEALNDKR